MIQSKYGDARYQERRNDYYRNAYDGFLNELGKYGLGKRDLAANINFFSKVTADDERQSQVPRRALDAAGSYVDLRFEMNTLVVLAACPASARSGNRLSTQGDAADDVAFASGAP